MAYVGTVTDVRPIAKSASHSNNTNGSGALADATDKLGRLCAICNSLAYPASSALKTSIGSSVDSHVLRILITRNPIQPRMSAIQINLGRGSGPLGVALLGLALASDHFGNHLLYLICLGLGILCIAISIITAIDAYQLNRRDFLNPRRRYIWVYSGTKLWTRKACSFA